MQYLGIEWQHEYFFGVLMIDAIEYLYLILFSNIEYHAFEMFNSPIYGIYHKTIV